MLTLLLWRKVNSSVILPLKPLAFHCISRRQLVGVGSRPVQGSFRYHRHTEVDIGAAMPASAAPIPKSRLDE